MPQPPPPAPLADRYSPAAVRLARAAVDVVADEGLTALSVRTVAHRAGVTGGAVQHHFRTRAQLLAAAFDVVVADVADRVLVAPGTDDARTFLRRLCLELLPLDAVRRRETLVWLAFSVAAATDQTLAPTHRQVMALLTPAVRDALVALGVPDDVAVRRAAVLVAALDGLTLHCLSGSVTADAAEDLVDEVLETACRPAEPVGVRPQRDARR